MVVHQRLKGNGGRYRKASGDATSIQEQLFKLSGFLLVQRPAGNPPHNRFHMTASMIDGNYFLSGSTKLVKSQCTVSILFGRTIWKAFSTALRLTLRDGTLLATLYCSLFVRPEASKVCWISGIDGQCEQLIPFPGVSCLQLKRCLIPSSSHQDWASPFLGDE